MGRTFHAMAAAAASGGLVVIAGACSSTGSSSLTTDHIRAEMWVTIYDDDVPANAGVGGGGGGDAGPDAGDAGAPDHGSFISADLYKDDSLLEAVNLEAGDSLYVATNLNPHLDLTGGSIAGFYETPDHLDLSGLTDATFVFTRKSGASAPSSHVTAPPAIKLTSPKQDDTVALANGKLTFTWSNPAAGAKVFVMAHPCGSFQATGSTGDQSIPDTGSFDVAVADLGGAPSAPGCYFARIIRTTTGTVDPAWQHDSKVGVERDYYVSFTLTP